MWKLKVISGNYNRIGKVFFPRSVAKHFQLLQYERVFTMHTIQMVLHYSYDKSLEDTFQFSRKIILHNLYCFALVNFSNTFKICTKSNEITLNTYNIVMFTSVHKCSFPLIHSTLLLTFRSFWVVLCRKKLFLTYETWPV